MILNKVVTSEPALHVPGHLSFGQYIIDKLRENCETEDMVSVVSFKTILSQLLVESHHYQPSAVCCLSFERGFSPTIYYSLLDLLMFIK